MTVQPPDLDKQKTIADAAFEVFASAGFRGTSMQMIAARAGMSRPALYLHFQNKEDVFRHLIASFFAKLADEIAQRLTPELAPDAALKALFDAFNMAGVMERLLDAPHGADLLAAKGNIGADLVVEGEARIAGILEAWLHREARAARLSCADPGEMAQTILTAHHGLKVPGIGFQTYQSRSDALAEVLGRGLLRF